MISSRSALQKYFRKGGTPEKLKEELGIKHYRHPDFPLIGFKYDQIKSPKTNELVREARGIVFDEEDNWALIAKGFNRFFNVGEVEEEWNAFYWRGFICTTKEDGSLILVYYYRNEWLVNTSGSFGFSNPLGYSGDWQDLFWEYAGRLRGNMRYAGADNTYIFELCTPINKVVRRYEDPGVFLLGVNVINRRNGKIDEYYNQRDLKSFAKQIGVKPVKFHFFDRQDQVKEFLLQEEEKDPTFEGVVIMDKSGRRYKWKTESYRALHRLYDNGNIIMPKNLVSIVLTGRYAEIAVKIPEVGPALAEVSESIDRAFADLAEMWLANRNIEVQKNFALKVKDHPFFFILFKIRKVLGAEGTVDDLKKIWRETDHDKIAQRLFNKRTFEFAKPGSEPIAAKPTTEPEAEPTAEPEAEPTAEPEVIEANDDDLDENTVDSNDDANPELTALLESIEGRDRG